MSACQLIVSLLGDLTLGNLFTKGFHWYVDFHHVLLFSILDLLVFLGSSSLVQFSQEQCCPIELSTMMKMSYFQAIKCGSH